MCSSDLAGALDHHAVADADVLAGDLVLVVERGAGDDDAADGDRRQRRHRRQRAGAPDFNRDVRERSEERRGGKECRSRWSPYH